MELLHIKMEFLRLNLMVKYSENTILFLFFIFRMNYHVYMFYNSDSFSSWLTTLFYVSIQCINSMNINFQ